MKIRHIIILSLALASLPVSAQSDSFQSVISTILDNNPDLLSRRELITAQKAEAADNNSLDNPEIEVSPLWGTAGRKLEMSVSQAFDWPGAYAMRSKAADAGITAAELMAQSAAIDLRTDARLKLTELVYVRQQIDIQEQLQDNIHKMSLAIDSGYRSGIMTLLDKKKIDLEAYKISAAIAELHSRLDALTAQIQALCPAQTLDLSGITAYPPQQVLSADEYNRLVSTNDPLMSAYFYTAKSEELNARAASRSRMPGFSLGYRFVRELGDNFHGFSVSMSLPFFRGRNAKAAALARGNSARLTSSMLAAQRSAEISSSLANISTWQSQIRSYNSVFGDGAYLRLMKMAYDGGEINLLDYLNEVNYFSEATMAYLAALYAYNSTLATLNRFAD